MLLHSVLVQKWGGECRILRTPPEDLSPPHQDRHQLSHWALHNNQERAPSDHKPCQHPHHKLTRGRSGSPPRTTTKSQKMKSHTYQGQMQSGKISNYKTMLSTKKCTYTFKSMKITLNQNLKIIRARWIKSQKETRVDWLKKEMRKKDKIISYKNINCKVLRGEKSWIKIHKNSEEKQKNRIERGQRKKKLKGQENTG